MFAKRARITIALYHHKSDATIGLVCILKTSYYRP